MLFVFWGVFPVFLKRGWNVCSVLKGAFLWRSDFSPSKDFRGASCEKISETVWGKEERPPIYFVGEKNNSPKNFRF